jgi:hypothetical protein
MLIREFCGFKLKIHLALARETLIERPSGKWDSPLQPRQQM